MSRFVRHQRAQWAPATIALLNKALDCVLANAEIKAKFAHTGTEPATSSPEGLEKFRLVGIEKWHAVIATSGFNAD